MGRTYLRFLLAAFLAQSIVTAGQLPKTSPASLAQPDTTAHVTLGQSAVPLYGPWKFTVGDSPIDPKTGKPLWAEPEFDDSKWETVDLTPKDGAFDPVTGLSGYVPGWTAKGHPGYWGYAWYRLRVQVLTQPGQARQGEGLALAGPAIVDDVYQVFDNGTLAGHFGDFTGSQPVVYSSKPKMFPLGQPGRHQPTTGKDRTGQAETGSNGTGSGPGSSAESTRVLAFRLWMAPGTLIASDPDAGGMHSAPVLGEAGAVAGDYQLRWLELIRACAARGVQGLLFSLLALVAFSLIQFDRTDRVYLWMGALFLIIGLYQLLLVIGVWTELQSYSINDILTNGIAGPLTFAAWVMVFWVWFGLERPWWLPRLTAGLTLLLMISTILGDEVFFGLVPHDVAVHFFTVTHALQWLFFALLLWVVTQGIRRQGVEGWLVLPLVALRGTMLLHFRGIWFPFIWFPFGVQISIGWISNLLVAVVIALLLMRRLLQSVKRQRLMTLDVKQAQEVQQVILPEALLTLPGLTIESEYRPSREVGGDFFQIIPHKADGSLLVVAGDVTGKGLVAGMLVALLVGAIRTAAETSDEPESMLATLNRRLLGRGDAQATCLALKIEKDGAATLANAGHMAPYLNGEPMPMEGALPLGMVEGAEMSVMHFQLKPSDRLVLMSDGISEATNAEGQLFGFERTHELLRSAKSVAEIAGVAQAFGQEDDISLISVTRNAVLEPAFG